MRRLKTLWAKGYWNWSASELAEWRGLAAKGAYNYTDLNRVESAVVDIARKIGLMVNTKTDWTDRDVPTQSDMVRYLRNIERVRDACPKEAEYPTLPTTMQNLTYDGANKIEEVLSIVYRNAGSSTLGNGLLGELILGEDYSEISTTFEDVSWHNVRYILENNQGLEYWAVGDQKTIPIVRQDGETVEAVFKIGSVTENSVILISKDEYPFDSWCTAECEDRHYLGHNGEEYWYNGHVRDLYNNDIYEGLPRWCRELVAERENETKMDTSFDDGSITLDRVWILSVSDVTSLFPTAELRKEFFPEGCRTRDIERFDSNGDQVMVFSHTSAHIAFEIGVS